MNEMIETMATTDFAVFLLGLIGIPLYVRIHKALSKCNPTVFSVICVILTYIVITLFQH